MPKVYTREEADEILRRALSEQTAEGISHEDLVAAAREVGIPETAIEAAAGQLGDHRLVKQRVEQLRAQRRRSFVRHLLTFLSVNGGIFLFDYFDGGPWFFQYVLIVWSIFVVLFGIRQLAPEEAALVRKAERELEKEKRRAERERRRKQAGSGRPALPGAAKEFEAAVQDGVSVLMTAAARMIRDFTPAAGPKPRYRAEDPREADAQAPPEEQATRRRQGRI